MCGLAGYFGGLDRAFAGDARAILRAMSDAIRHRGPDGEGQWVSSDDLCGLAHRRLSIIDLSPAGAQPMVSQAGSHVIAFNGEIYNFADLRRDVEARRGPVAWRSHSDTEVLLELIADLGVGKALERVDGMFALAVYDLGNRSLTLARDAFGEKPIYYGYSGASLLFGSELKALSAFPGFAPETNTQALADYFKYAYVPAPASIYEGIYKLPPAHVLTITQDDVAQGRLPEPSPWWEIGPAALSARKCPFSGTYQQALEEVRETLTSATKRRLMSDVPLGALLSGGIDSSLVTALMQSAAGQPVKTFSIGMDEPGFNEAEHARAVATHLGTDHHELILSPRDVQSAIPAVAAIYDEPFADSSQVPTYLVARMARERVTVALSGDGGDEVFGGYNRYFHAPAVWSRMNKLPASVRRKIGALAASVPPVAVDRMVSLAGPLAPRELSSGRAGEKLQKLARVIAAADATIFHDNLLAITGDVRGTLSISANAQTLASRGCSGDGVGFAEQAMLLDAVNYMPDDVLVKVDRASMAVALEMRTPFLSRELYALAWSLPMEFKVGAGQGKRILRELLYTMVPRDIVDRPKSGFAIPVGRWLRTGLRDWAEEGLSISALTDAGIFDVKEVRHRWSEHLSGRRDYEAFLWAVLMYQGWRRAKSDRPKQVASP
ncbi:MAG: asparagine synthase (glutamine-hydrolyzing) [Hyphomicrobium sp. 32-62-53]|nr:MAG: asparagine synthase (glutamine-hydrolyzing) [Hyphomicrobium sp. 12-62-95]OYX97309.1 MAG: asparagine synthase (glutamine-hydrolyzing) [Hyphomicrobium sp. 32-62-53]